MLGLVYWLDPHTVLLNKITHNIGTGIQMKQKQLDKTFMMTSRKKPLIFMFNRKIFRVVTVNYIQCDLFVRVFRYDNLHFYYRCLKII